jgi:TonB family protein
MTMKLKKSSGTLVNLKLLMVMPVIVAVLVVFSSCGKNKNSEASLTEIAPPPPPPPPTPPTMKGGDTTWVNVDEMPVFPGGDKALLEYIAKNAHYPDAAKAIGTQGKVIVRFCITSKGNVSSCEIVKGVSPDLDAEAIRVVNTLTKFEPGKVDGKPVSVWYMVPITFALK